MNKEIIRKAIEEAQARCEESRKRAEKEENKPKPFIVRLIKTLFPTDVL